jgi:hypothetical protein
MLVPPGLNRAFFAVAILTALAGIAYVLWDPCPSSPACFNRDTNGLWLGHRWYTGIDVRRKTPVTLQECDDLARLLQENGIRYAYLHAGPIRADGSITDAPGHLFFHLKSLTPGVVWLPWLGGDARKLRLGDSAWRSRFIETLDRLRSAGFAGVHLDIESIADGQAGYVALLREIGRRFGAGFFISHATRRIGPWSLAPIVLKKLCRSERFYKETMAYADQTVLMVSDTRLLWEKPYIAFVNYETSLLLDWARAVRPGHRVMIGIPAYEDMPAPSGPRVENIRNAALGVRAALEREACAPFEGVAVYAHGVVDSSQWKQFRNYWLCRPH